MTPTKNRINPYICIAAACYCCCVGAFSWLLVPHGLINAKVAGNSDAIASEHPESYPGISGDLQPESSPVSPVGSCTEGTVIKTECIACNKQMVTKTRNDCSEFREKLDSSACANLCSEAKATPPPTRHPAIAPPPPAVKCKYSCSSPDRDCSDFSSHSEAQAFFDCCGFTKKNDPMQLDGRGNIIDDGVACEKT